MTSLLNSNPINLSGVYFQTSPTTEKLDNAICKAQGEFERAVKDKTNPQFKSKHTTFEGVVEACRPALLRNGISVTQWVAQHSDGHYLYTRVACGGEYIVAGFKLLIDKLTSQGMGAAITYAKRYAYGAIFGIQTAEDDDGVSAYKAQISDQQNGRRYEDDRIYESEDPRPSYPSSGYVSTVPATAYSKPDLNYYVIPVGGNKGKKLSQLNHSMKQNEIKWLTEAANQRGGKLTGDYNLYYEILMEMHKQKPTEEIPF